MLFNPNWIPETKTDVFSLESLIAWLETQNPKTTYVWTDPCKCVSHEYLIAMNSRRPEGRLYKHGCALSEVFRHWKSTSMYAEARLGPSAPPSLVHARRS